ncbi:MAG TPA: cytochrome c oxidase subunit II [Pantanalinema sp.]
MPRNLVVGVSALAASMSALPAQAVGGVVNATSIADRVDGVYNLIFWITTVIFIGVWVAMAFVLVRFRAREGGKAQQIHGNTALEIVWTVIPAIILIAIAIPTYKTMKYVENAPKPDLTIQVVGHQWFWEYKYPDNKVAVSNADLVLPANKVVKVLVSSADVVHNWGVSALGFSMDAIPGHINEGWLYVKEPGEHEGFCRQLCGTLHAKMTTKVRALPDAEWQAWIKEKGGVIPATYDLSEGETRPSVTIPVAEAPIKTPDQVRALR